MVLSKSISDHWKEKVLLVYSRQIALITIKITGLISCVGIAVVVVSIILDRIFSLQRSTVDFLMSWQGISVATIASIAYFLIRRPSVSHSDYGFPSRLLHRIALGVPFVTQTSFDIERALNKVAPSRSDHHVFVTGLARSGTTILLRALYETEVYRSLTYRDMPFVVMPNVWKRFSKIFRIYEEEKERAHGDRIQISFDSPESFEEVFWRTFCGDDYIKADYLCPHSVDPYTIELFVEFVSLVIASGDSTQTRYLSKNNNNILRLSAIHEAFPNATILIPFRDPIQQANSLLKQHVLFSKRHQSDTFSYDYMKWLAHHEFGLTHRPFRFAACESRYESRYNPTNINYWLNIWLTTYRYVLEVIPEGAMLVCYENLCSQPKEIMDKILRAADVESNAGSLTTEFKAARRYEAEGLDKGLTAEALSLYERMQEKG